MTTWADLDKVSVTKPRADGSVMIVVRDERTVARIRETPYLSIIMAISRVSRARDALSARFGGRGTVIYHTAGSPPGFLVEAVTAAGGVVFDGTREHGAGPALATTAQLDAAFCDLASAVRRRLGAKSFRTALEILEADLRRKLPEPKHLESWWTAIIELSALTGECVREKRAARWIVELSQQLPLALDLGKDQRMVPGNLAQTLVEGGAVSMTALIEAAAPAVANAAGVPIAMLCDRRSVPIDKLSWERLISAEVDTDDVPVIAFVDDLGGTVAWTYGPTMPDPARRRAAFANLAKEPFEIMIEDLPNGHAIAIVAGTFYAAESLLVPTTMEKIRRGLGGPKVLLVGVPARGQLVAIDGDRAMLDEQLEYAFLMLVENRYLGATERDQISSEIIVYTDRPQGRLQSNLMDARRLLRAHGADPDE